jgi:hypothetical protein
LVIELLRRLSFKRFERPGGSSNGQIFYRKGNYERLFDEARHKVRAWEKIMKSERSSKELQCTSTV